jgi:hypothetical protein
MILCFVFFVERTPTVDALNMTYMPTVPVVLRIENVWHLIIDDIFDPKPLVTGNLAKLLHTVSPVRNDTLFSSPLVDVVRHGLGQS